MSTFYDIIHSIIFHIINPSFPLSCTIRPVILPYLLLCTLLFLYLTNNRINLLCTGISLHTLQIISLFLRQLLNCPLRTTSSIKKLCTYMKALEIRENMLKAKDDYSEEEYADSLQHINENIEEIKQHLLDDNMVVKKGTDRLTVKNYPN